VKDIRLSSMLTLILEAISVLCILALAAIVLFKHGIAVDSDQVNLTGVTFSGMSFAVVACIFSLVGFESATALGGEARNALQTIPKAVIWSDLEPHPHRTVLRLHGLRRGIRHPGPARHPGHPCHPAQHSRRSSATPARWPRSDSSETDLEASRPLR
jgi:hypothetical protein